MNYLIIYLIERNEILIKKIRYYSIFIRAALILAIQFADLSFIYADQILTIIPRIHSNNFEKLSAFEKFFITREQKYVSIIQDQGGRVENFFGLQLEEVMIQNDHIFISTKNSPENIRNWAEILCKIDPINWKIKRNSDFTAGEANGLLCNFSYQPKNKISWFLTLTFINTIELERLQNSQ